MYVYTSPTVNVFTGRIPFFDQLLGLFSMTVSFSTAQSFVKHCLECTVEPQLSRPRLSGFLDYPDFFSGPNFVMIIYKSQSRSVAISFFKLQHWKVQSNARFCLLSNTKGALARVVTNEEHSNEFWNYYQILHLIATTEWHKNVGAHIFELQAAVCKSRNPI